MVLTHGIVIIVVFLTIYSLPALRLNGWNFLTENLRGH